MGLDIRTLFFLTMHVEALLGILLLLAWVQNWKTRAMAWWASAHFLRSLSVALYGQYGNVPDLISIEVAGFLLFISYGLTWAGARVFEGRSAQPWWIASGAVIWVAANRYGNFAFADDPRNLLSAAIV